MDDLSALTAGLSGGASMHAGNTVSERPAFAAPGSPSEGTANAGTSNHPEMDLGSREDYALFQHSGAAEAFQGYGWSYAQGVNRGESSLPPRPAARRPPLRPRRVPGRRPAGRHRADAALRP